MSACIFCRIIKGEIPSFKILETAKSYSFLDIQPLSRGHALVIPKEHTVTLHELSDDSLADLLPVAKKVAKAIGVTNYNILQNNGRIAHQVVDHVHIHIIPKPDEEQGLGVGWPAKEANMGDLRSLLEEIKERL